MTRKLSKTTAPRRGELLEEMDSSLIRLEKEGSSPELLNNIFRAVHCIKGSAEYIGLERSSTLTHGVENLLDKLREGMLQVTPATIDFLFRVKDLVSGLIDEVTKEREERTDISTVMRELESFTSKRMPPEPDEEVVDEEEILERETQFSDIVATAELETHLTGELGKTATIRPTSLTPRSSPDRLRRNTRQKSPKTSVRRSLERTRTMKKPSLPRIWPTPSGRPRSNRPVK